MTQRNESGLETHIIASPEARLAWSAGYMDALAFFYLVDDGVGARFLAQPYSYGPLVRFCAIFKLRIGAPIASGELRLLVDPERLALILDMVWPYLSLDTQKTYRDRQREADSRFTW